MLISANVNVESSLISSVARQTVDTGKIVLGGGVRLPVKTA